nr:MAG TPA: hypothetical protein [Caudoviricetes sp.]
MRRQQRKKCDRNSVIMLLKKLQRLQMKKVKKQQKLSVDFIPAIGQPIILIGLKDQKQLLSGYMAMLQAAILVIGELLMEKLLFSMRKN